MGSILPFKPEVEVSRDSPLVVDLDGEASEAIFSALASDTSREIYRELYEDPTTASGVAERVDTTVQNARYHLEKLEAAGLIDPVDTWYSSRGNEMTVYAATNEALIVAGDRHRSAELRSLLTSTAGGLALLAGAAVVLHWAVVAFFTSEVPQDIQTDNVPGVKMAPDAARIVDLDPGLLVFLGGLVLLLAYAAVRVHRYRVRYAD